MNAILQIPRLLNASLTARRLRVRVDWLKAEAGRLPCVSARKVFLFFPEVIWACLPERAKEVPKEVACHA